MIHKFAEQHGRSLKFEIEPGTFLLANAGVLLSTIQVLSPLSSSMTLSPPQDIVSTGSGGYNFLKIDAGMTEVTATLPLPRRKSLIPCPHGRSFVRRSMAPLIPFKSSPTLPFIDSKPVTQPSTMSWCDPLSPLPHLVAVTSPSGWPLLRIWRPHFLRPWSARDPRAKTFPSTTDR